MPNLKVVTGEGPTNPRLILIGESLGEQEEIWGRPFYPEAPSGRLLMGMLSQVGLRREDVYLDNVVPIRPPSNKIERLPEMGLTWQQFIPSLEERLSKIDCNTIVALGGTACKALTGMCDLTKKGEIVGIAKHRGSIYNWRDRYVVPSFHPRFIIENWKMMGVVVEDVKKAMRVRKEGHNGLRYETRISPTLSEVENYLSSLRGVDRFAFDIETVGSGQIACIGFGADFKGDLGDGKKALCIPFKFGFNNYWDYQDEALIWKWLKKLFQGEQLKIGQNMNFDLSYLLPFIGEPAPPWYDLMMAHHLIEPELPHTLAFQTSLYTWPVMNYYKDDPKDEEKSWKYATSSEKLWDYNCKDVISPLLIERELTRELKEMNMLSFFEGFMMSKMRVLWRMQQRGLLLDEEKRQELLAGQLEEIGRKQEELELIVGHPLEISKNKQVMDYLYGELKLPIQHHRKTKKATVDEDAIKKLYAFHPNPSLKLILSIRKATHDIGTYLMVEPEEDGRVRGRYNAAGAATGRSSSKKNYDNRGLDLHNIPEEDRQMFMAPEGNSLIVIDLWQAEAIIVSQFSHCQAFLSRLKEGKKTHRLVASWIFKKPEEEVDNINRPGGEYFMGKRASHGLNYGLGPILLAINLECEVKRAKEIRDTYFRMAWEIETWQKSIQEIIKKTRKLTTPFGRIRIFRDRFGDDLFRKAYAHIPQSTIGELNHLVMIKLEYLLPDGAELVQEGYDALMVESKDGLLEEVERCCEIAYDKEVYCDGEMVRVPRERSVNKRWLK